MAHTISRAAWAPGMLVFVLMILPGMVRAKTWSLTPADSIQETIHEAEPDDIIVLQAGSYPQDIEFDELDSNITLRTDAVGEAIITGHGASATLNIISSRHIRIFGLVFRPDLPDVDAVVRIENATYVEIESCFIEGKATSQGTGEANPYSLLEARHMVFGLVIGGCGFSGFYDNQSAIHFEDITASTVTFIGNTLDCSQAGDGSPYDRAAVEWHGINQGDESEPSPELVFMFERNYIHGIGLASDLGAFLVGDTDNLYFHNNVIETDPSFAPLLNRYFLLDGDSGDVGVRNLVITNNTFSLNTEINFISIGSKASSEILITNNLIDGALSSLVSNGSSSTTGCLMADNHARQMSAWLTGGEDGWEVQDNYNHLRVVWNNAGSDRPYPYFQLEEDLQGGPFHWCPDDDFLGRVRETPPDVGAFEFLGGLTCENQRGFCCVEPDYCPGSNLGATSDCARVCCQEMCTSALEVTTTTLPDATLHETYDVTLEATGGTGGYTWSLGDGELPMGIQLERSGRIYGDPTQQGSYSITVVVEDEIDQTESQNLDLEVLEFSKCPGGLTDCNGTCTDLQTDPLHCGACQNLCVLPHATAACAHGFCTVANCETGRADCNLKVEDGCESVLGASGQCVQGGVVYEEIACRSVPDPIPAWPGLLVATGLIMVLAGRRRP